MHETSVRAVIPLEQGGRLCLCGLPGLEIEIDGSTQFLPLSAELTFEYLKKINTKRLYLLMEDFELPEGTRSNIEQLARDMEIDLSWMPIVDFGIPDQTFEVEWNAGAKERLSVLSSDGCLALSCLYGAGRSGMMAAATLAELGTRASKAVRVIRKTFPKAVGSLEQEDWVANRDYQ
jgi:protein-tyrosine phosphatase